MANDVRDSVRSRIFSAKKFETRTIKIFDQEVEVRQPSIGQIVDRMNMADDPKQVVDMLIEHCYVPGTDTKVFDPEDKDSILSWPVGQWFTEFNNALTELMEINVEEAEKN